MGDSVSGVQNSAQNQISDWDEVSVPLEGIREASREAARESLYQNQIESESLYDKLTSGVSSWFSGVAESASMFSDWVFGSGAANRSFKPGSIQVEMMRDAPKVNAAREFFINKNKDIPIEFHQSVTNYGAAFGLKGLANAGVDPIEQYVGSYDIDIHAHTNGTVTFELNNNTSMRSFLYGLFFSWERSTLSPFGNMRQSYSWVEPNPLLQGTDSKKPADE